MSTGDLVSRSDVLPTHVLPEPCTDACAVPVVQLVRRPLDSVRNKLTLLRLADEIGSVLEACRAMGYSRGSFYRIRARYLAEGEAGLGERNRRKEPSPNRFAPSIEAVVVEVSRAHPDWGRRRIVGALAERGLHISPSGVRCVWKRHGLLTPRERREAPELVAANMPESPDAPVTADIEDAIGPADRFGDAIPA